MTRSGNAILLLGPTGSGKTPLGELLQQRGLRGRRCAHFDFGENLRRAVSADVPPGRLTDEDVAFVKEVLAAGALLEDEHFHIAGKILRAFIERRGVGGDDLVVLNGLPRHAGQARDVDAIVRVTAVVQLRCTRRLVAERIRTNAGGDRTNRTDDNADAVDEKLEIYVRRTAGLVAYYGDAGVPVEAVDVQADSTAEQMWHVLNRSG